jgi:hypothetical protein
MKKCLVIKGKMDGKENGRQYNARKMGWTILNRRFVRKGMSKINVKKEEMVENIRKTYY